MSDEFQQYLMGRGIAPESAKTYESYLTSVVRYCGRLPKDLDDIDDLADEMVPRVSVKSVRNYRVAMKHYLEMKHAEL